MENILIQTSQNGSSFTDLKTPSSYKLNYEDTDSDSYRSVINGDLIRNRIQPRWIKLELSYRLVSDSELNTIARAVNTNQEFWVRCKSPAFGNMGTGNTWTTFRAYVSKYQAEMIEGQVGWKLSFNIIQSKHGDHQ